MKIINMLSKDQEDIAPIHHDFCCILWMDYYLYTSCGFGYDIIKCLNMMTEYQKIWR